MKKYKMEVQFIFTGEVTIKAEDKKQAKEYFEKHVGLVIGGNIHNTLPSGKKTREFYEKIKKLLEIKFKSIL